MNIQVQKLILIMMRISSFVFLSPGFSFKGLPNTLKVALGTSISMVVYMITDDIVLVENLYVFALLILKEIIYGLALGYVTSLVFGFIETAGELVDFQAGFSMGQIYDPMMEKMASYFGRIYYWLGITVFFTLNLHHNIIEAIIKSFNYVPIGEINIVDINIAGIIKLFSMTFELAVNFAAPIVIVALVTDIILGVVSRTVPQINVLMLGMPLKALVSFGVSFITLSWVMNFIGKNLSVLPKYIEGFFNILG